MNAAAPMSGGIAEPRGMRDEAVTARSHAPHEPPLFSQAHCRLCFRACHFEREVAELDVSGGFDWGWRDGREYDDECAAASEGADRGDV